MSTKTLITQYYTLPKDAKQELADFLEYLLTKHQKQQKKKHTLSFNWEGGLSDLKDKYTSVELQHKINELKIE